MDAADQRRRTGAWASWGLGALLAAAALAAHLLWGPFPVLRGGVYVDEPTPGAYTALVFLPFGVLAAELAGEARRPSGRRAAAGALAVLVALAFARLGLRLPLSGHALFAVFYVAHASLQPRSTPRLLLGVALVLQLLYYKLVYWRDLRTLALGVAAGLLVFAAYRLAGGAPGSTAPAR